MFSTSFFDGMTLNIHKNHKTCYCNITTSKTKAAFIIIMLDVV